MTITKTARQNVRNNTRYYRYTLAIYRDALQYVNNVVMGEWVNIAPIPQDKARINAIEKLIHGTARRKAVYADFDKKFVKFPSYLRRKVIAEAIGHLSSHQSRLEKWKSNPKGKEPKFQSRCNSFPVFYKENMFEWLSNGKVRLKFYNGSDWIWFTVPFEPINIEKRFPLKEGWERQNPMLVQKGRRWRLHFPFEREVTLKKKDFVQPVLSVDLGLTTTAVCSAILPDGTVTHREFITYGGEKDRLDGILARIAVKSAETCLIPEGEKFCNEDWRVIRNLTEEIAHQCSADIVELAVKHDCQSIVFEHLGKLKVPKDFYGARRLRKKLHYWLQGRIQKYTKYKGHAQGIRFSRVLARGTSEYAYDGSGKVHRIGNRQIAVFSQGQKIYNADLSASYNIGARYWIREIRDHSKSPDRKSRVVQGDKSSPCAARHQQTLASLISLARSVPHGNATVPAPYPSQCHFREETANMTACGLVVGGCHRYYCSPSTSVDWLHAGGKEEYHACRIQHRSGGSRQQHRRSARRGVEDR